MIKERNYILPGNLFDALVKYLVSRPYSEVQQGLGQLFSLKTVETHEQLKKLQPKEVKADSAAK